MLLHHVIAVTALSVPTESTAPTAAPVEEAARHAGQSAPRQAPAGGVLVPELRHDWVTLRVETVGARITRLFAMREALPEGDQDLRRAMRDQVVELVVGSRSNRLCPPAQTPMGRAGPQQQLTAWASSAAAPLSLMRTSRACADGGSLAR